MKKKLVGIVYNQHSDEDSYLYSEADEAVMEEVNAIKKSLARLGFDYMLMPFRKEKFRSLLKKIIEHDWFCIVNLCESIDGKNLDQIQMPATFDIMNICYTGSGTYSLAVTTDKAAAKGVLAAFNLPVPRYNIVTVGDSVPDKVKFPIIVKPQFEDASVGIDDTSVVYNHKQLVKKVHDLHTKMNQSVILEQYIDGREINVAVFEDDRINALPVSEIIFKDFPEGFPRIVTYKAKWDKNSWEEKQTVGICPAKLSKKTELYLKKIAVKAFKVSKCRDYARVDIRLNNRNKPYIIEVNANPDISPDAGFMRSWYTSGRNYDDFVKLIVHKAHNRGLKA
ncbi:MAG: hypothetical protein A2Y62_19435 [Candidatus Fischerbacteria bacterium RBG_13_37_8]|uniref:ATP-grasp domain-containing protein n=1 Tax=Candidatus Fischerbacteria bacterium RBG_13_37_8 TaxID=1817863 RepID=A0A1F5VN40_9BACT|nr:MAG: hypothetical protein A2Y62_19435 [Candidatus Fischerbacteria bacterium RBG_13_37_8]